MKYDWRLLALMATIQISKHILAQGWLLGIVDGKAVVTDGKNIWVGKLVNG